MLVFETWPPRKGRISLSPGTQHRIEMADTDERAQILEEVGSSLGSLVFANSEFGGKFDADCAGRSLSEELSEADAISLKTGISKGIEIEQTALNQGVRV